MAAYTTRFLAPCETDFTVVSDTHDCAPDIAVAAEFPSRSKQRERAQRALALAASLRARHNFHLGDLVQLYPESDDFDAALDTALEGMRTAGFDFDAIVPGNHDVGDKPDATMPTHPLRPEDLAAFEKRFGQSRGVVDAGAMVFLWINSQILGAGLPEETAQWEWLEATLDAHQGRRIFAMLHLPAFVCHPGEPAVGHYDNIDRASRRRLLALFDRPEIECVLAGHVHHRFRALHRGTPYLTAPSPAFNRPGYGHFFDSPPLAERGRDDVPKLGFLYGRVRAERTDLHFVATGDPDARTDDDDRPQVLTRLAGDLPRSPVGVHLLEPLVREQQIPETFPAAIRQPARNDYPWLALENLGLACLKTPVADWLDPAQRGALEALRDRSVRLCLTELWSPESEERDWSAPAFEGVDAIEWRIPHARPDERLARVARTLRDECGIASAVAPVFPFEPAAGKQHPRPRFAFRAGEIASFLESAAAVGMPVDRLTVADPEALEAAAQASVAADLRYAPGPEHDDATLAEAVFAVAARPGSRLFVEPLLELDRTMDAADGLLDRRCNPRPAFHRLRLLNTLLFHDPEETFAADGPLALASARRRIRFVPTNRKLEADAADRVYFLDSGTVADPGAAPPPESVSEPVLVEREKSL